MIMKDIIKTTIEISISNIEVDEQYYSFSYSIKDNGKTVMNEEYSNDYENWMTPKEWKKFLIDGEAVKLALQQYSEC